MVKTKKLSKRALAKLKKEADAKLLEKLKIEYNKKYDSVLEAMKEQKAKIDLGYRTLSTKEKYFVEYATNLGVDYDEDKASTDIEARITDINKGIDQMLEQIYDEKISEEASLDEYQQNINNFDKYQAPAMVFALANQYTELVTRNFQQECAREIKGQIYQQVREIIRKEKIKQCKFAKKYYEDNSRGFWNAVNGTKHYNKEMVKRYDLLIEKYSIEDTKPTEEELDEHSVLAEISIFANEIGDKGIPIKLQEIVNKIYDLYTIDQGLVKKYIRKKCESDVSGMTGQSLMTTEDSRIFSKRKLAKIISEGNAKIAAEIKEIKSKGFNYKVMENKHTNAYERYETILRYQQLALDSVLNSTEEWKKEKANKCVQAIIEKADKKSKEVKYRIVPKVEAPTFLEKFASVSFKENEEEKNKKTDVEISEDMALGML